MLDQDLKPGRVTVNANWGKGYLVPTAGKHIPAEHAARPGEDFALTGLERASTPELPIFPGAVVGAVQAR